MKNASYVMYAISAILIGFGFHRLFIYNNPEGFYGENPVNAHVGGDAYNMIINAGQSTAFFVAALIFAVFGSTLIILDKMTVHHVIEDTSPSKGLIEDVKDPNRTK